MTATESSAVKATTGVPFTLNGQELHAEEGELLIEACDKNGVHIPRFCYHKRMESVGMCRMCIVEVDTGRGPALQPSCMLTVTPEMKVETESEATKDAQDGVLELLLANHPLDCPVCDKGGECPLQDNAFAYGPGESRFVEEKRHFEKPIPISDLVKLDRERCILCDRCTRFASDVAGDSLIHFIDRGSSTQVNTFPDHPFASYYSGNTVQICPVGALTAAPYRFKARPWDLTGSPSTATVDSSGSRVLVQSSQDKVVRIQGVDSDAVNWGWLSDKERFIYEANVSEDRILQPMRRAVDGSLEPMRWNDALKQTSEALGKKAAAIGGARLTLEAQHVWQKVLADEFSVVSYDASLGDDVSADVVDSLPKATYDWAFNAGSVVVVVGQDLKEILPSIYLRLRGVVKDGSVELVEFNYKSGSLAKLARKSVQSRPGELAKDVKQAFTATPGERSSDLNCLVDTDKPLTVIFSRPNVAESADYLTEALQVIQSVRPDAHFLPAFRRGNTVGAQLAGLTPGVREVATEDEIIVEQVAVVGRPTAEILQEAANGEVETLLLLGADPISDFPDKALAEAALDAVNTVIAVDCFENPSVASANVILPVAMYGEVNGHFVNSEGRLSPLGARVTAPGLVRSDLEIAASLAKTAPQSNSDAQSSLETSHMLGSEPIAWDLLELSSEGARIKTPTKPIQRVKADVPTVADGLRLVIGNKLWDQGTIVENSRTLAGLCETFKVRINPADADRFGLTAGAEIVVKNAKATASVPFITDSSVAEGVLWAPANVRGFDPRSFVTFSESVCYVEVSAGEQK